MTCPASNWRGCFLPDSKLRLFKLEALLAMSSVFSDTRSNLKDEKQTFEIAGTNKVPVKIKRKRLDLDSFIENTQTQPPNDSHFDRHSRAFVECAQDQGCGGCSLEEMLSEFCKEQATRLNCLPFQIFSKDAIGAIARRMPSSLAELGASAREYTLWSANMCALQRI